MPIYHYKCLNCDHKFTRTQKYSEKSKTLEEECEECGEQQITTTVAPSTFVLRGQTWSKDGYA